MTKLTQWRGKDILDPKHAEGLERHSAELEFGENLPRHQAEEKAYQSYRTQRYLEAAAHHWKGFTASAAVGDLSSKEHKLMYDTYMRALGKNPAEAPPPEVKRLVPEADLKRQKFVPHEADQLPLLRSEDAARLLVLSRMLMKSKNVREQTRNLPQEKIIQRLHQFAATKNLGMKDGYGHNPHAVGNILHYGGVFTPEHELAHALMTPNGTKIQGYYDAMNEADRIYEKQMRIGQIQPRPWSENHEVRAVRLEPHIERRAGIRGNKKNNPYYLEDQAQNDDFSREIGRDPLAIREQVKKDRARIDNGLSFTNEGVATTLQDIHAKINARAKK